MHQLTLLTTIVLFTVANLLTSYLYLYPIFHGCAFSVPPPPAPPLTENGQQQPLNQHAAAATITKKQQGAPFRLLLLGDPQLEGSTSLPPNTYSYFPSLLTLPSALSAAAPWLRTSDDDEPQQSSQWQILQRHASDFLHTDLPVALRAWRKRLDLLGNDFYLAHIYRSLQTFTVPTHTAVLGDLLGSQWIDDEEFEARAERFWGRVFADTEAVGENITNAVTTQQLGDTETDAASWRKRVINIVGNHDIGYAGDVTVERVRRFERAFGPVNWATRFTLPFVMTGEHTMPPELQLVVLNSLNIDGPVGDVSLQAQTLEFMDQMKRELSNAPLQEGGDKGEDGKSATILLTHLPLHKEAGVCVDGPMIRYAEEEAGGGVIREQNHLSYESSARLLDTFFGLSELEESNPHPPERGRRDKSRGMIFTGHDHEGCDVYHQLPPANTAAPEERRRWTAERWNASSSNKATHHASEPGIREVTVRSMMGDFGGNAGLLSAWYDAEAEQWEFAYASCALGKQHLWWAVHVLDVVALGLCLYTGVRLLGEAAAAGRSDEEGMEEKKRQ